TLMIDGLLHEITHALGRDPDNFTAGGTTYYSSLDVFRFLTSGNGRDFDGTTRPSTAQPVAQAYFSLNGGLTDLADFGVYSDPSDWLNSQGETPLPSPYSNLTPNDPFDEYVEGNGQLTSVDREVMEALGFSTQPPPTATNNPYDFNGDGFGDILLQSASGQIEYANMAGGSFQGMVQVASTPGWTVVGAGKVAGNVDSDIVILNNASGEIFYRDMLSGGASHWVDVTGAPGYAVIGVGDINHGGFADIVIQNHSDGTILFANMANGVFNGWKALTSTPGWNVVGVADVNNDGFADVLIENQSDGTIFYGNMAGGVFNHWVPMTGSTLPGWKAVGAGDIMHNGNASEVIQESNGSIVYANMTGGVFHNWLNVGATPGWNFIGAGGVF